MDLNDHIGLVVFASFFIIVLVLYYRGEPPKVTENKRTTLLSRDALSKLGRPSLILFKAVAPGFSKIGGRPELPAGLSWPSAKKGPRLFLAQLDLSDLNRWGSPDWLPSTGRIYVFADDERAGFADHCMVLFSERPLQAIPTAEAVRSFPERRVEGRAYTSFPSPDWLGVDGVEGDQKGLDEFVIEPAPIGRQGMHRVGGFPSEIQGGRMSIECEYLARGLDVSYEEPIPAEIEEAAKSWRMLLQIDSDRDLKMNWWDGGRFYIFIREEDARAGDFSKTVTISQSY